MKGLLLLEKSSHQVQQLCDRGVKDRVILPFKYVKKLEEIQLTTAKNARPPVSAQSKKTKPNLKLSKANELAIKELSSR